MAVEKQYEAVVQEALRQRGRTLVRVQGRSMYPALRHGSQVEVQPVVYDELQPGDLLVFADGRGLVCHRLLGKAGGRCRTKGDTNLRADPPVEWARVVGRVARLVSADLRLTSLDTPEQRRRSALLARFSYLYALYLNLLYLSGQCRWWKRAEAVTEGA